MRTIKIGIANVDTTVGAIRTNTDRIIAASHLLTKQQATIGVFSEQVIPGYPAEDLVQWKGFVAQQWDELLRFADETRGSKTVFVVGLTIEEAANIYNVSAVVAEGKILGLVPKEELPTYGVFYEGRTCARGIPGRVTTVNGIPFGDLIFQFPFGILAVEVCEDVWSPDGPMRRRAYSGAELIVNSSSSPWRAGVVGTRREMVSTRAADNVATVVYANQVGGNDGLVFDGGGFVNQGGRMLLEAPRWKEGVTTVVVDLDVTARMRRENTTWRSDRETFLRTTQPVTIIIAGPDVGTLYDLPEYPYPLPVSKSFFIPSSEVARNPKDQYFDDLIEAMILGLDGYFRKTTREGGEGVFKRLGIALSGGKDSAFTLLIAYLYAQRRYAGLSDEERAAATRDLIYCISMPSRFNSSTTRGIAETLAEELGVTFKEVSIAEAFLREVEAVREMLPSGTTPTPITLQNIQARIRGSRMLNWSNTAEGLFLQTGNMSEKAVGYTTVGGDLEGGYGLIANLPKTVESALIRYLNDTIFHSPALEVLLGTKESAELAEGQEDEKDLMPFPVLDACFALFAGAKMMPDEVYLALRQMWTEEELRTMRPDYEPSMLKAWVRRFVNLFRASIFKWVQAPQSVHLGTLDLDRERALQLPVVQSAEWLLLSKLDNL